MDIFSALALSPESAVCDIAANVLETYGIEQITFISGPRVGMVQLRVRESVRESDFNAGEVLVTETRLELRGQFGFGMVVGNRPRHATAIAIIDAAIRHDDAHRPELRHAIALLVAQLTRQYEHEYAAAAATKVEFEVF
jgi:alpha-D-ribose 1-methylphosphonate 5-triphosphate synthase subunit PhnG